jgi:2-octaprenylphenol hydroxylase
MKDEIQMEKVVIVGGGLVGGLCALLFAEAGIQAIVLDAAPELDDNLLQQRDARVLALSPATISLLKRTQVWQHIQRRANYVGMQVWTRDGYGQLDFGQTDLMQQSGQTLGSMVEPSVLGLAIQQQLKQQVQQYITQAQVKQIERFSEHWQVTLQDGQQINTALLIGADGGNSFVRRTVGIDVDELDYHQTAMSCAIRTEKPHRHIARQVFLPTGPLAFLPMTDVADTEQGHWQSVVWTLPEQDATELSALSDTDFLIKINQASGAMLGEVQQVQSRASFPLKAKQAQRYVLPHVALIGDAAHVVHPMAGQGVNLGCMDAAVLVDCILKDFQRGVWAGWQALNRYESARRVENSMMMHGLSALGWLQGTDITPIQWARNEGAHWLSQRPSLLDQFNQQASGWPSLKNTRYSNVAF